MKRKQTDTLSGLDFSRFDPRQYRELARELRQRQTSAEEIVWGLVRNRQFIGLKFRRQHPIDRYIVDFYCHDMKLIIELDGGVHATSRQKDNDKNRDRYLASKGFRILRFSNDRIFQAPEDFLAHLAQEIQNFRAGG